MPVFIIMSPKSLISELDVPKLDSIILMQENGILPCTFMISFLINGQPADSINSADQCIGLRLSILTNAFNASAEFSMVGCSCLIVNKISGGIMYSLGPTDSK